MVAELYTWNHYAAAVMTIATLTIIAILIFSAVNVTAISFAIYTDNACASKAANPVAGMSNPTLALVDTCFKSFTVDTTVYYNKVTVCNSVNTTSISYSDSSCTVCPRGPCSARTIPTGTCITSVGIPGVGSYKIACSASTTAAVAALSFVAMIFATLF
jgi:hypothetical protein